MVCVRESFYPELYCQRVAVSLMELIANSLMLVQTGKALHFCFLFEVDSNWIISFGIGSRPKHLKTIYAIQHQAGERPLDLVIQQIVTKFVR